MRTISSRQTNEFRASYGRENVEFGSNGIGNTVPSDTAISSGLTLVSLGSGNLSFGPADNLPQGRIVNSYQLQDNWTYIVGRHALKAGVNFTYQRSPNYFLPYVNGGYSYATGNPYVNLAENTATSINVTSGDPVLDFREKDSFLYVQDDFKVKNNLTLNLGLTWSYYGQPANLFHDKTVEAAIQFGAVLGSRPCRRRLPRSRRFRLPRPALVPTWGLPGPQEWRTKSLETTRPRFAAAIATPMIRRSTTST